MGTTSGLFDAAILQRTRRISISTRSGHDLRVASVSRTTIDAYIAHRRQQYERGDVRAFRTGGWKATLNRELTVLSQVFDAAIRDGRIKPSQKPVMPDRFRENPPRQGHIDPEAGAALMRHMPQGYALASA